MGWTGLRSLRVRLTLLVIASLLPVLWLFIYTAQAQRETAEHEVTEDVRSLARLATAQQERLIESARQLLFTAARLPDVRSPDSERCQRVLSNLLAAYPIYGNLGVADTNGDVRCMARDPGRRINIADRSYFRRALERRDFAMGEYMVGRATGRPQVNFGYPLLDEKGEVEGVVYVGMDLEGLNRLTQQMPLAPGGTLLVVDRNGTVLVRAPDPERWVGRSLAGSEFLQRVLQQGKEVALYPALDGVERLFATEVLNDPSGPSARLVIGVPKEIASGEANRLLKRNLRVLGVVAAATLLTLWLGGNWFFLRRVRALVSATERITQGDFSARTGLRGGDELGKLGRAFDEMAAHTEEALARKDESLALIDTLFGSAPVGLAYFDRDGRYIKVNDELAEMNGLPAEAHLGKRLEDVVPDLAPALRRYCERVVATGVPEPRIEVSGGWREHPALTPRTWVVGVYPVRVGREGAIRGVGMVVVDVTERKREEEAQRFLAEASRVLSESLRGEVTLQQVAKLAVPVLADWCAVDVLREDDSIEPVALAYRDPADAPLAEKLKVMGYARRLDARYGPGRAIRTGETRVVNDLDAERAAQFLDPDDPRREEKLEVFRRMEIHAWMTVPMKVHGRSYGALTLLATTPGRSFDERDRWLAEELARRAALALENAELYEEVEQAVKLREQFMSVASHELRTPLTPLKLQLQTLQRKLFQGAAANPADLAAKFALALRQTDRLSKLVDDLLDVSRLSLGKLQLHREDVDLSSAVLDMAERFREEATRAGSELRVEVPDHVIGTWDPSRIEQVLVNLLSNAIKYGGGKPIEVRVEPPSDDAVRLIVRDHGIGIATPDKDRIFERFERAVSERAYGGLGLGLYIAREIVLAHGGTITVDSAEGEGSTFIVELPLQPVRAAADAVHPGPEPEQPPAHQ